LGFPRHEWRGYYQKSLQDFVLLKSKPVLFINFFLPMISGLWPMIPARLLVVKIRMCMAQKKKKSIDKFDSEI